jgi:hypothetical protein
MANEKNLKPAWEKGQSGNPSGKPKGIPNAATRYQRLLKLVTKAANPVTGEMEDYTQAELMDMRIMSKALKGDLAAYKEIVDRLEGRAKQAMDLTTGGQPLNKVREMTDNEISERLRIISETKSGSSNAFDGTGQASGTD